MRVPLLLVAFYIVEVSRVRSFSPNNSWAVSTSSAAMTATTTLRAASAHNAEQDDAPSPGSRTGRGPTTRRGVLSGALASGGGAAAK